MTDICSWTGPPWERNDPRAPGPGRCEELAAGATYCAKHAATYARWLRNRDKGPERVEQRRCGNPECDATFQWSSWGQDQRYHASACKKRHEQLVKIGERATRRETLRRDREVMREKQCVGTSRRPGCLLTKPIERFRQRTPASLCIECEKRQMVEYDSQRGEARAQRRRENLVEVKAGEYNLAPDQYQHLLERAGGRCEICQREVPLDLDHVRETGVVRGLLCRSHNLGLGLFGHDQVLLARAMAYLVNEELHVQPMGTKGRPCERCKVRSKLPGRGMRRCGECFGLCLHCDRASREDRATCARHESMGRNA